MGFSSSLKKILRNYIFIRVIEYIASLFILITINFFIPRLIPGDPLSTMIARLTAQGYIIPGGKEIVEAYRQRFGLSGTLLDQYLAYLSNLLRGDLGLSISAFPKRVDEIIFEALPWSIGLLSIAVLISWIIGNILGVFVARVRSAKLGSAIAYTALFFNQVPYYIFAMILIYLFAYLFKVLPISGSHEYTVKPELSLAYIIDVIRHSLLPALSIILISIGGWMITMRSIVVTILGEDYLLFAEAKGLKKGTIFKRYLFRNALLPQVTGLAISLGQVVSGSLLVELVFGYPGIGYVMQWSVMNLDYNVMQGCFLIITIAVLTSLLFVDIISMLIDPRVRRG
ncbi:ABC transporter permease [Candidatus Bathyarchaeota archaeon]|nr:ABC transporter permease [Candidatus Bathyarchaeota archaeon]